jgi:ABC-2 type transport system permease protein
MRTVPAAARAELTKIFTLRSVWLITALVLGLHVLVNWSAMSLYRDAVDQIGPDGLIEIFTGERNPATVEMLDSLSGGSLQMTMFLPVLAVVIAGQEYRSRQLGLTLLAVPQRGRLLAAKVLAMTGYTLLVAILIAAISTVFTYAEVKNWNAGLVTSPAAVRLDLAFLAYALLFSLVSMSATMVVRSTLIGVMITIALVAVTMTQILAMTAPAVDALLPMSAGRNLLLDPTLSTLSSGPRQAMLVLIAWAIVGITAAGVTLSRRDAR